LRETRPEIARSDRRINFENAVGKFFNPHDNEHLEKAIRRASRRAGIIAPEVGRWEIFF
jgi:hypothetical protein